MTKRPDLSTDEKKELFLLCFAEVQGNISEACRFAGIHRQTYYLWSREDENFAAIIDDIEGETTDRVISKLQDMALNGDKSMIKYYLDHKGKSAGFGKRSTSSPDLPPGGYHLHLHGIPEPKSLSDWEQQVQDARDKRSLNENNETPIDAEIVSAESDSTIENESQEQ